MSFKVLEKKQMTEEEKLAKEYADKRIGKVLENSTFPNSYWHRQDWENCKQDFLAGLKVGKDMNVSAKWHDLRQDPNDLPKRDERFSINISIAVMTQDNGFAFYSFEDKKWYFQGKVVYVIAWCEIPTFDKE